MDVQEILAKVKHYIKENQMLEKNMTVVIGLSGGPDSMAMTDLLCEWKEEWNLHLTAVHVNHGIRGEEAIRDQSIVEDYCKKIGIPLFVYEENIPLLAKRMHMGVEEAGRYYRKKVFLETLKKVSGPKCIALAHNQNDLAETVLHHLSRGSGLRGLSGILPKTEETVRPVLCLNRKEIEYYCEVRGISYVTDHTNLEDHYTRNRIRHHILPLLETEINSGAIVHLAEAAKRLYDADQFIQKQAVALVEAQDKKEDGVLLFPSFFQEPNILTSYALFMVLEELCGRRKDLTSGHIESILQLYEKNISKRIALPYEMEARRVYDGVWIGKCRKQPQMIQEKYLLPENGHLECGTGSFITRIFSYTGQKITEKKYTKWFDYDKIKGSVLVRKRMDGDYLILNQAGQKKKLNRYMIDEKISSELRDQILILACGSEVLWVIGGRIGENYKITKETKTILEVLYIGGESNERKNQSFIK